jgi:Fe-S cluster biogenesis protein NfuA/nitrite reductase/ring-hydroxylating ferredoxin subunit
MDDRDVRERVARVETLLAEIETDPRAIGAVQAVVELYGEAFARLVAGVDPVEDELVSHLLLVHDLHPVDVETRVRQALDDVRPYLGSHGGDVELLEVSEEGTVRLRLLGSCDGCPSSSVTLKLAVEGAIEAAAPEITGIEVEEPKGTEKLIPVSSLRSRLVDEPGGQTSSWEPAPELADLAPGAVTVVEAGASAVLVCRLGSELFAYLDRCARCEGSMRGAALSRRLGAAVGEAVLRCPTCRAHYDARRAGACLDDEALHLVPVPLLTDGGITSMAVAARVSA